MVILGLWDGHDSGAAVLVDGRLTAAVNEERLSRRKLEIRFPSLSIGACLEQSGLTPADVDLVAASTTDPAKTLGRLAPWTKERYYRVRRRLTPPGALAWMTTALKRRMTEWPPNLLSSALSAGLLRRALDAHGLPHAPLRLLDHHACHAWTAALGSRFDAATVVTIDGLGDGTSASVSAWHDGALQTIARSPARDSLGVFFEIVTNLLGMRELEDEGKVMALADYAAPVPDAENPLLRLFDVQELRVVARAPAHALAPTLRALRRSTEPERFARLAQRVVERVCVELVRQAVSLTGLRRVALAGGVVSNVKATRLVRMLEDIDDVYVFPHMGDGGLALGAAWAAAVDTEIPPIVDLESLALGPAFSDDDIATAAREAGLCLRTPADLTRDVVDRLEAGQIVFWFQGRMEYGPRALGHRSILARPDRLEIRDRLNRVLKRRAWYQPFCPSLLESDASRVLQDWTLKDRSNRHMTMAYQVAPAWRKAMAGVTSIDGTCRPQVVDDARREPFADVLRGMKARFGTSAVLNTSLNLHGQPLVCTPQQACDLFKISEADALVMHECEVVKS